MSKVSRICTLGMLIILTCSLSYSDVDTSNAVIHHTASHDVSVNIIRQWHLERGFSDVGYHYVIRANGDIEKGRSLKKQGAHAKGRNHFIGIALTGYDEFTKEQIKSLKRLLKQLNTKVVQPHHRQCPGKGLNMKGLL